MPTPFPIASGRNRTTHGAYLADGEFISEREALSDWYGLPEHAEGQWDDIPWDCPSCKGDKLVVEECTDASGAVGFFERECPCCEGTGIDPKGPPAIAWAAAVEAA